MPFAPAEMLRVPVHWNRFTSRASQMHDDARNIRATDPANAMLNYVYRLAEMEAVHACHALGLDPAMGILHADKQGRNSMALDVMEAIRPYCDRLVLRLLDCGLGVPAGEQGKPAYLNRLWFDETRDGQCKLAAPLTSALCGYADAISGELRPHAEHVARMIANAATGSVTVPRERKGERSRERLAPVSSTRPARLRDGVTADDILPDELWERLSPLIPEPPAGPYGRRKTGRPRDTSLDREVIAACAANGLLGVPWHAVPVTASQQTCKARLRAWQITSADGIPAWERIAGEMQGHGHLAALVALPAPVIMPRRFFSGEA
jgi:transposase